MATILVLAPMRTELSPIVRRLQLRRDQGDPHGRPTWSGRRGSWDVVAAQAGVGTARSGAVATELLAAVAPDHVAVVGVAGGLARHLRVADLVVPAVVEDLDGGTEHQAHPLGGQALDGRLLTSTVLHRWDVLEAHAEAGALAIDMETAAVAAACEAVAVPWTAVRTLSDLVHEGTIDSSSMDLLRPDGSPNLPAVARRVLRHPGTLPGLLRMGRDGTAAAKAAAAALDQALRATGDQGSGMGADAR